MINNVYLPSGDKYSAVVKTEICYMEATIVIFIYLFILTEKTKIFSTSLF